MANDIYIVNLLPDVIANDEAHEAFEVSTAACRSTARRCFEDLAIVLLDDPAAGLQVGKPAIVSNPVGWSCGRVGPCT